MKLKLDENLGERGRRALSQAGHDVSTVAEQGLASASDRELLSRCVSDRRALVTLDLDFANAVVFPPHEHAGVAVLRLPRKPGRGDLDLAIATLVAALDRLSLCNQLWIVEAGRLRVYTPEA